MKKIEEMSKEEKMNAINEEMNTLYGGKAVQIVDTGLAGPQLCSGFFCFADANVEAIDQLMLQLGHMRDLINLTNIEEKEA